MTKTVAGKRIRKSSFLISCGAKETKTISAWVVVVVVI